MAWKHFPYYEGILPKGSYLPCVSMVGRALLAGYHRILDCCGRNPLVTRAFGAQRAGNVELCCFLLCFPEQAVEQIMNLSMTSDAMTLMSLYCNDDVLRVATDFILDSHSLLITMHSLGIALSSSHCNFVTSHERHVNHVIIIFKIHLFIHMPLPYSFKHPHKTMYIS